MQWVSVPQNKLQYVRPCVCPNFCYLITCFWRMLWPSERWIVLHWSSTMGRRSPTTDHRSPTTDRRSLTTDCRSLQINWDLWKQRKASKASPAENYRFISNVWGWGVGGGTNIHIFLLYINNVFWNRLFFMVCEHEYCIWILSPPPTQLLSWLRKCRQCDV